MNAPYCADFNKTYSGASTVTASAPVTKVDECSEMCTSTPGCFKWQLSVAVADNSMTCVHYGNETGATTDPNADGSVMTFLGDAATCQMGTERPASPEDAQALQYREVCQFNQYEEEIMAHDDWNIDTCPSNNYHHSF